MWKKNSPKAMSSFFFNVEGLVIKKEKYSAPKPNPLIYTSSTNLQLKIDMASRKAAKYYLGDKLYNLKIHTQTNSYDKLNGNKYLNLSLQVAFILAFRTLILDDFFLYRIVGVTSFQFGT